MLRYVMEKHVQQSFIYVARQILRKRWQDLPSRMPVPRILLLQRRWCSYPPRELSHIFNLIPTQHRPTWMLHGMLLAYFLLLSKRAQELDQLDLQVAQLRLLHLPPRMVLWIFTQSLQLLWWLVCWCCWLVFFEYFCKLAFELDLHI